MKKPTKTLEVAENSEHAAEITTESSKGLAFSLSCSDLYFLLSIYLVFYHINVLTPLVLF